MPATYEVRQLTTREVASSAGRYEAGDVKVGPLTPRYVAADGSTGGVSEAQLKPEGDAGAEIVYQLVGGHAGEYALVGVETTAPFGWWVTLRRRETTP